MIAAAASPLAQCAQTPDGVLFAVFQNGSKANGGVESITQIIEGLGAVPRLVLTNAETHITARWRGASVETKVWPLPYGLGQSWRAGGVIPLARRLVSLLATNWWTWRVLRDRNIRAVHCNDPAPFWHVALGARLAGVPLLLNLRDTKSREEGLDIGKYRRRFRFCERVLVLSREMKEFYEQACTVRHGKSHPFIEYIYSAVDSERMRPLGFSERRSLRQKLGIEEEAFAVGFIATFNDKKNQLDYLREAVPLLRGHCPAAKTFFVGDFEPQTNRYAASCTHIVHDLGLKDCVRFVGFCSQIEKWYQACDVVVVPTRKEGLARCMIEAMACGTPVVSFDVASAREILEEHHCGRVVPQGDYEQLCVTLTELAESPELRKDYATNGVALAHRLFSSRTCANNYQNLILSLQKA